jgi:isoprenylcysteine carboxyl methyltransferase (ICMT) family protein YpbQ
VGVIGELLGVALMVQAPVTGTAGLIGFGALLVGRIRVENRALEIGVSPSRPPAKIRVL